ncbi:uncharacterized protein LOC112462186 [Temnothorax curvispinosus]|uniref:Uncharacterized protein LOC112462186 n=1 Tax=Temnothorax curvispinosus TaxID=300111 RepID=A0A6J1QRI5_9HYME|nr:uncharacterized protein LOC112462186 [Temnothorax curvispinosus]
MEKLKKTRAVVRTSFTRNWGLLNTELARGTPQLQEIQVRFALVREKANELEELNQKIFEVMINDDASDELLMSETEASDEYRVKYQQAKVAVNNIVDPTQPAVPAQNIAQTGQANRDNARTFKLLKIELPKFSGELKDWLQFWSLFKNIHEDSSITKKDKFQYLIQAMVKDSRAYELVNSFPPTAINYDKVITSLKNRFGREDLLVEVYIREMLKLVLSNTNTFLSRVYDRLESQLRALGSLGVTTEMCAAMLYPLVESSLPEDLLRIWERNPKAINATTSKQRLKELMLFLQAEVLSEERIAMAVSGFGLNEEQAANSDKSKKKGKAESKAIPTAAGLLSTKEDKHVCIFCGQNHESASCGKAKKMSYEERQKIVKEKSACFYCLKTGHSFKFCRYKEKCAWCGKKHVLLMCCNMTTSATSESHPEELVKTQEQANFANISLDCEVFLQTIRVKLVNQGRERIIRAIFDTGSHKSYVLNSHAEKLGFEIVGEQEIVHMLFGGSKTKPQSHKGYRIHIQSLDGSFSCNFVALNHRIICQSVPSVGKGPWLQELQEQGIKLTDVDEKNEPIALLIGADVVGRLLTGRRRELKCGPVAMETLLGWTLMGKTSIQSKREKDTALMIISMFNQEANIADLWRLDTLGITDPALKKTKDEHQADVKENFLQTIKLDIDDRYEVLLPWKGHLPLIDNWEAAERRLESTTKKLKSQGYYNSYQEVFDEWLAEGIIERVSEEEENSTTKIRPVFYASATGKNGVSLNQCLETGPNLIEQIPNTLLRFRQGKIGVISDIRKAFLQISISKEDRDVLRFLWWKKNCSEEIDVFRHKRVVFGVSSSPFLLAGTIEYYLEQLLQEVETEEEKMIILQLLKSFYVDNCVTSVNSEAEVRRFEDVAKKVMAKGKFDLRGWEYTGQAEPEMTTSVLGLLWNKVDDTLGLAPSLLEPRTTSQVTKRTILSAAQRLIEAKSRVAPVDKLTIARLELLAALIGVRLWFSKKNALDCEGDVFFWSDSTTVLAWIQRNKPWNIFVANRVKEIRRLTNPSQWHHVPGIINPADLLSRGCKAKQLIESRWWEGPAWLKLSREHWPSSKYDINEAEVDNETKRLVRRSKEEISSDNILVNNACLPEKGWYMGEQSKYLKVVRVMAWITRFISNCRVSRTSRSSNELTAKEFAAAELAVLKLSQQESFEGIEESRLSTLNVYEDESGLIRLKSPVVNREDRHDFRHPIILDPKHPLVKKLIECRH